MIIDLLGRPTYNWDMMKQMFALSLSAAAVLSLTGCKSAPMPKYVISIRDKPSVVDVRNAEACLTYLPSAIWRSPEQAVIDPGVGFTFVTVPESVLGDMDSPVVCAVATLNANHPINPVHIQAK